MADKVPIQMEDVLSAVLKVETASGIVEYLIIPYSNSRSITPYDLIDAIADGDFNVKKVG